MDFQTMDSETISLISIWGMKLLTAIALLIAGWLIGKWLSRSIQRVKRLDTTLKSFLGGLVKYTVMAIAFVAILGQLGVQTASLLAVLGAAGLAIGLALQGTLSNVAAGVMLLILRPFNVGDYIETQNIKGTVKELGLFSTELSTTDNIAVFAPNSKIWNAEILNFNRNPHRRVDMRFGISYNDDINKTMSVIKNILGQDENIIKTKDKEPVIFVESLGDFSVNITARIWTKTTDHLQVKWRLNKAVKEALDTEGISIPFPTRTILQESNGEKAKEKKLKKEQA
ncbi:MAG: mechanosensitive ion channel [Alphaproteobacteria bacterium]|nr:mechanosensitive ion channel [Alphaproteobacteria bacterium]